MLDEHRSTQPIFSSHAHLRVQPVTGPRERTLAELELERHLVKEKEDSHFPECRLHVPILGKEAMDHAEKPGLLSAQFHNIPLVRDPAKSVVPNDHLGDQLSTMLNDHERGEAHEVPHDHFGSVINLHPHSSILNEMRYLLDNGEKGDNGLPLMKSAMKN